MPPPHPATNDRRAVVAPYVMFALMVQALVPTAAMATAADGRITLCTAGGTQTLAGHGAPSPPSPHRGGVCQDCLVAAVLAVTPPPAPDMQPVT
ncbi:MAG TPA: hypothetical protein VFE10_03590 [Phenylobacterium sp.]|jgi:hypothetical protein|nr:hypothetical protein [Phenylobacterium sp.]